MNNDAFGNVKVLLTITTIFESNWKSKLEDINELGIEEVAVFPTCLDKEKRGKLYDLIKKSSIKNISFMHLRSDMDADEIGYVIDNFGTKVFNVHSSREYSFVYDYSKYRDVIYIENAYYPLDEKEIEKYAGICLDFSHLENDRLFYKDKFENNIKMIEKFRMGCNHISAIREETYSDSRNKYDKHGLRHDFHEYKNLSEFDYLKNYPKKFFSPYIAIELENSIKEQLIARDYIEKIISKLEK